MSRHATWKDHERRLARQVGGVRNGVTGMAAADVESKWLCIEAKCWRGNVKRVESALIQAEKVAKPCQLPIAVIHTVGRHSKNDLVVMRWGQFQEWFGDTGQQDDGEVGYENQSA
jgi:hypothetical protein